MTQGTSVIGLMGLTEDLVWSEPSLMASASMLKIFEGDYPEEDKARALFNYAALLVSMSVTETAEHILGKEAMEALEKEAEELSKLGEGIK